MPSQRAAVKKSTAIPPAGLRSALQQGMSLFQAGRIQDAERVFQSALSMDPKNVNALQLLGIIHFQTGRFKEGEQLLRRAIKQSPSIAGLHFNLGNMLDQQGKLKQALVAFENAIKLGMGNDEAYNNLGMVLSKLGRLKEAEKSFLKAIKINSNNPSALSNYGLVLRKTDRQDEAIKVLMQAIDVEPRFVDAYSNLGAIYYETDELDKADDCLQQALKIDASNSNVMNSLAGVLLRKNQDDAALAMVKDALKFSPQSIDVMLNMAKVCLKIEDEEEAVNTFHRILEIKPDNSDALVGLGWILFQQGKLDGAKEYFKKALQVDSALISARVGLIELNLPDIEDVKIKDLEGVYESAETTEEDKTRIAFCLGKTYERSGRYKQAFNYLTDGNRLKRKSYEYSLDEDKKFFTRIKEVFNEDFFHEHSGSGHDDRTPIFILGMPRSGTTLTEQILSCHPLVFGAGELPDLKLLLTDRCHAKGHKKFSEIIGHFRNDDFSKMGMEYVKGLKARESLTERVTDKMPHNFLYVGLIRLMLPNAKVIHCRRDPIDNCFSIFKHNFQVLHKYAYDLDELGNYYLLYKDLMDHWHKTLPGFMFDLQYEDMVADQEGMTRKLLEFCDLPWDDVCLQFHKSERTVKTASYTQVRKKIYSDSVQLWKRYEQELQPLIAALSG